MSKITDFSKTIVALATALGAGSIAVIRISGSDAISIVNDIFSGSDLLKAEKNTIHFGQIINDNKEIDQVLISVFKSPHSYTGEDVIEISCHANPYIVNDVLDILISRGAVHAKPGEFTLRAFLNGKIDLSQAEAVSDIINAKTKQGLKNSMNQLDGVLTREIHYIKSTLIDILGLMEIDLDFSEENIKIASSEEIIQRLTDLKTQITHLINSYNYGKLFNGTLHMAIAGNPNTGKSTLMNRMVGESRAITSKIPGTTRDTLHENVVIDNIYFRLVDTAGLRKTEDQIESMGIDRAKKQILQSDIVLYVIDISVELSPKDFLFIDPVIKKTHDKIILVANKIDKKINRRTEELLKKLKMPVTDISAKSGEGFDSLRKEIITMVTSGLDLLGDEIVITSARHKDLLERTRINIDQGIKALALQHGFEFTTVDLREALNSLAEITGETATDDILNRIFENFCIGK